MGFRPRGVETLSTTMLGSCILVSLTFIAFGTAKSPVVSSFDQFAASESCHTVFSFVGDALCSSPKVGVAAQQETLASDGDVKQASILSPSNPLRLGSQKTYVFHSQGPSLVALLETPIDVQPHQRLLSDDERIRDEHREEVAADLLATFRQASVQKGPASPGNSTWEDDVHSDPASVLESTCRTLDGMLEYRPKQVFHQVLHAFQRESAANEVTDSCLLGWTVQPESADIYYKLFDVPSYSGQVLLNATRPVIFIRAVVSPEAATVTFTSKSNHTTVFNIHGDFMSIQEQTNHVAAAVPFMEEAENVNDTTFLTTLFQDEYAAQAFLENSLHKRPAILHRESTSSLALDMAELFKLHRVFEQAGPKVLPKVRKAENLVDYDSLFGNESPSLERFSGILAAGHSLVYSLELLDEATVPEPYRSLMQQCGASFGVQCSLHIYATGPQGQALPLHTDNYDVFVVQLSGSKLWDLCEPEQQPQHPFSEEHAIRAKRFLQSTLGHFGGLNETESRGLRCHQMPFHPGTVMYLPMGTIHRAVAVEGVSIHMTIGVGGDTILEAAAQFSVPEHVVRFQRRFVNAIRDLEPEDQRMWLAPIPRWQDEQGVAEAVVRRLRRTAEAVKALQTASQDELGDQKDMNSVEFDSQVDTLVESITQQSAPKTTSQLLSRSRRDYCGGKCTCSGGRDCDSSCENDSSCGCDGLWWSCNCDSGYDCDSSCQNDANCQCKIGYYGTGGTSNGNLNCYSCQLGTYGSSSGLRDRCTSCPAGQFQNQYGQTSCKSCPSGTYSPTTGRSYCSNCDKGWYASGTSNTGCTRCPTGQYADQIASSGCKHCGKGKYQNQQGQDDCKSCPTGQVQPSTRSSSCNSCPKGYFMDQTGQLYCKACQSGKYTDQVGRSGCKSCPVGSVQRLSAQSSCDACPKGKYQPQIGQTTCLDCPIGKFQDQTGQGSCKDCSVGKYQNSMGQDTCKLCDRGKYQNSEGKTSCIDCSAAWYQDQFGQASCKECKPGSYNENQGQHNCKPCAAGYYQPQSRKTSCDECPKGEYTDVSGSSSCKGCANNYYADQTASTKCKACQLPCGLSCAPCIKTSGLCPILNGWCAISNKCYQAGPKPITSISEADACLKCDPSKSKSSWSPGTDRILNDRCRDVQSIKGDCTHSFRCQSNGICAYEVISPKTCSRDNGFDQCTGQSNPDCIIADALKDRIHRYGPDQYGCIINGSPVPHGTVNPNNPCEECDVYWIKADSRRSGWKPVNGKPCDDGNACTYTSSTGTNGLFDTCNAQGQCRGTTTYSCASHTGVCLQSSACKGDGTCQLTYKSSSTVCRSSTDACDATERCTGSSKTCPNDIFTSPSISAGSITLRDAVQSGSYMVRSQKDSAVRSTISGTSVSCGDLVLRWGLYEHKDGQTCSSAGLSKSDFSASTEQTVPSPVSTLHVSQTFSLKSEVHYSPMLYVESIKANKVDGTPLSRIIVNCQHLFMKDDKPPTCQGAVDDGGDYTRFPSISAAWSCTDKGGIETTYFAVGTSSSSQNVISWTNAGSNVQTGSFDLSNHLIKFQPSEKVFLQIKVVDFSGQETVIASDGIYIDLTDPIKGTVTDGAIDVDYWTHRQHITVAYSGFSDDVSPITNVEWRLCHASPLSCPYPWTNIGSSPQNMQPPVPLVSGEFYLSQIRVTTAAGRSVTAQSDAFQADFEPPRPSPVHVVDITGNGISFWSDKTKLHVKWEPFVEEATSIDKYTVCVVDKSDDSDVKCYEKSPSDADQVITLTGLSLSQNTNYAVHVSAYDQSGLESDESESAPVLIDDTAPETGTVMDVRQTTINTDVDYFSSSTGLYVSWKDFNDPESNIAQIEVCVSTAAGSCNTQSWQTVASVTQSSQQVTVTLISNRRYFLGLRMTNGAGLATTAWSDGVLVDLSPPTPGTVLDGSQSGVDIEFQADQRRLWATWSGFSDGETSIDYYEYGVGNCQQGNLAVQNWVRTTTTSAQLDGLNLQSKSKYCFVVRAVNKAGSMSQSVLSNGVTIDAEPITGGIVLDGLTADVFYVTRDTGFDASWSGFISPVSPIVRYEVGLGLTQKADDVMSFTNVGTSSSYSTSSLSLSKGTKYYVTVRATNVVGTTRMVASNGFIVDITPPAKGEITCPSSKLVEGTLYTRDSRPTFVWSGFSEQESALESFSVQLKDSTDTLVEEARIVANTFTPAARLQDGAYTITVTAHNAVNLESEPALYSVTIDATPPLPVAVWVGTGQNHVGYWSAELTVPFQWQNSTDAGSGVAEYKWAVCQRCGCDRHAVLRSASLTTNADWHNSAASAGSSLIVTVMTEDGIGNRAISCSPSFVVDTTPPVADPNAQANIRRVAGRQLRLSWPRCVDHESGMGNVQYWFGAQGETPVYTDVDITDTSILVDEQNVVAGEAYSLTVRCTNKAGLTTEVSSDPMMLPVPPSFEVTFDDDMPQFVGDSNHVSVSWTVYSNTSFAVSFEHGVSTSVPDTSAPAKDVVPDNAPWISRGSHTSAVRNDIALSHGGTYFHLVRASLPDGQMMIYSSEGFQVDLTVPEAPSSATFGDDAAQLALATANVSGVLCRLSEPFSDGDSGMLSVSVTVECSGMKVVDGVEIGPSGTELWCDTETCQPAHGWVCTCGFVGRNGAGLVSSVTSDAVRIDTTPPLQPSEAGFTCYSHTPATAAPNPDEPETYVCRVVPSDAIRGYWNPFSDPESSITDYYCWSTNGFDCDLTAWAAAQSNERTAMLNLTIRSEGGSVSRVYLNVKAVNDAGLTSEIMSTWADVDWTPPAIGAVRELPLKGLDGLSGHDVDCIASNSLRAAWQDVSDPESGVVRLFWAVGSAPGLDDLHAFEDVGLSAGAVASMPGLTAGTRYYVTLRAVNGAGMTAEASSNGFTWVGDDLDDEMECMLYS